MSFFGSNTTMPPSSTPAKPGFFGQQQSAAPPAFGSNISFGQAPAPSFGAPAATTAQTGFGSAFGGATTTATTTLPTLGGFSSFGGATTSAPTLFGGTTTATSSAPAFSGFGSAATSTAGAFTGFGAPTATTSTAPAFSGFGSNTSSFGGFGTTNAFSGTSTFGKPPGTTTATPGFGGFSGTTNFMLGQQQQPQQAPPLSSEEAFAHSILNVSIYGDERDIILAKWNHLQALWGTGKSFYSQNAAPLDITPENILCRFKAMGYAEIPGKDNKMGLVAFNINKPLADAKAQQQQITATINGVLGNKPNLVLHIESFKILDEKKCQLVIYVEEKSQLVPTETKIILATDIAQYFNQPASRTQLNNLGVIDVLALVHPDEDQIKSYLENPPKSIDPRMWRQAIADNPNPKKLIPVPMVGFSALKHRIKWEENETEMHALYLRKVEKEMTELRQQQVAVNAKIIEYKRQLAELSHRALKVIIRQEAQRKAGLPLTAEEEALRTKLQNMNKLISAPTQFKGRISELLSQMRMQRKQFSQAAGSEYTLDKDAAEEMKSFLTMQQRAMEVLTETVTKDLKALKIISDGMRELSRA